MFLLNSIDLVALIGLFVQAFVAWIFVAVFASMRRRRPASSAYDAFLRAFLALALALTVVSVRFFRTHDLQDDQGFWQDGRWPATCAYVAYMALKALFGLELLRGGLALVGRPEPRWLRSAGRALVAAAAAAPLIVPDIAPLLVLQAPVMIGCAVAAWLALVRSTIDDAGARVVRVALLALAVSWAVHAVAALLHGELEWLRILLALNSFVDLAVQLTLGTGLIIGLLEEAQRRAQAAERERARLQREHERDEKLRALGTLVSGVAHELNNPLTAILGYSDLLRRAPNAGSAARIIGEQAERCRGIVQSLSALAGRSVGEPQELDVGELVQRVVRGLAPSALADGTSLRVAPISGLRIVADRTGLEQVLANLIANAAQASPRGGAITIDSASHDGAIELSISDQGPGVPRELRARVFEPFFTTKAPGRGTGLGLAIAHAIVREHGGSITIDDGPDGRGATFRVRLPRVNAAPASPSPEEHEPPGSRRLLVVDDDDAVREVVRAQAQRRGWRVSEADTAEAALDALASGDEFDGVLCDLRMPGIGGVGLHDRMARDAPEVLALCVFVTGDLASQESVAFSKRCRRPLVQKPLDFDELFAILARGAVGAPR